MEAAGNWKENVIEGGIEKVRGLSLQRKVLFIFFVCLFEEDGKYW